MGFLAGLAGSIGGGLLGGAIDYVGAKQQQSAAVSAAREQMAFQKDMFSRRYQIQMRDMRKAGLNPILSYSQGPPSAPSGAKAEAIHTTSGLGRAVGESVQKGAQTALQVATAKQAQAQVPNIEADTRLKNAQASTEAMKPTLVQQQSSQAGSAAILARQQARRAVMETEIAKANITGAQKEAAISAIYLGLLEKGKEQFDKIVDWLNLPKDVVGELRKQAEKAGSGIASSAKEVQQSFGAQSSPFDQWMRATREKVFGK